MPAVGPDTVRSVAVNWWRWTAENLALFGLGLLVGWIAVSAALGGAVP